MVSSGKPLGAVAPRDFAAEHRAHRAVHVANRQAERNRRAILDRLVRLLDQLVVQRVLQAVVLRLRAAPAHVARHTGGL